MPLNLLTGLGEMGPGCWDEDCPSRESGQTVGEAGSGGAGNMAHWGPDHFEC